MSHPEFVISPMEPSDVPALQALIMRGIEEDFGWSYNPDWHWDVDHLATVYTGTNMLLVAKVGDQVVGCGGIRMGAPLTIDGYVEKDDPEVAQITRLSVLKEWRRHGIARAIVQELIEWAKAAPSVTHLYLHTHDTHDAAIPFWESTGARVIKDDRPHDPVWRTVHYLFDPELITSQ
ncbi:GNAT family N-acetyltransferase [Stomatohabitans albus]|uniref:GNAT family N-acetyltransferase n=1 Tax=Stomatohabitans albus TaxID=3110766 RepID=UPI00300CFED3